MTAVRWGRSPPPRKKTAAICRDETRLWVAAGTLRGVPHAKNPPGKAGLNGLQRRFSPSVSWITSDDLEAHPQARRGRLHRHDAPHRCVAIDLYRPYRRYGADHARQRDARFGGGKGASPAAALCAAEMYLRYDPAALVRDYFEAASGLIAIQPQAIDWVTRTGQMLLSGALYEAVKLGKEAAEREKSAGPPVLATGATRPTRRTTPR